MATEKIMIQIGDEVQELKGAEKEAFLADRKAQANELAVIVAAQEARKQARISALQKLGLTEEEINAIL